MKPLSRDEIEQLLVPVRREEKQRSREKEKRRRRWREMPPVSPTPRNTVRRDITAMIRYHETSWGKDSFRNHCLMGSFEAVGGSPETYRVLRAACGGMPAIWNNAPERSKSDVLRLLRGILQGDRG